MPSMVNNHRTNAQIAGNLFKHKNNFSIPGDSTGYSLVPAHHADFADRFPIVISAEISAICGNKDK